jgi:hypothetical protein
MNPCPNCGSDIPPHMHHCPNCGQGAPSFGQGCLLATLTLFAVLGGLVGGCGLLFTVAMLSAPPSRDEYGFGTFAVMSLIVGGIVCWLCIWGIRSRGKKR